MPSWTDYQSERPTREQWDRWLTSPECRGIGLVCGAVSGNLEGFEVEGTAADIVPDLISAIRRAADERGLDGGALIAQFMTYLERSPRLGFHWVVQVVGAPVLGNTVLASRPDPDNGGRPKAIIETRGEGGFFVAAPTPAVCHNEEKIREAGLGWQIIAGTPGRVGVLTAEEYRLIHEVARTFDEMHAGRPACETPQPAVVRPSPVERPPGDLRPGDDFNQRTDWADILVPAGWTLVRTRGDGTSEWTRPGKHPREGISATTGYGTRGHDLFFPFTTSTEFTAGKSYDKYGCFALLEHGGDWKAAGRELRRRGYGSNRPREKYDSMGAVFGPSEQQGGQQNGQPVGQPVGQLVDPAEPDTWVPVDLTDVLAELTAGTFVRAAPTVGVFGVGRALFYRGKVNLLSGESNVGKSWTALQTVAQQLVAGEHVLYIDMESNYRDTCARLVLDLGCEAERVAEFFHYVDPDRIDVEKALALIRSYGVALVVIDSIGEAMALCRVNGNNDDEVAHWFRSVPGRLAREGPAVLGLDHTNKSDVKDPGLYGTGSFRKRAAASGAAYMQRKGKGFRRGQAGYSKIVCAKDREGNYAPGEHVANLDVTDDGVFSLVPPPFGAADADGEPRREFRPTVIMEKVSVWLAAQGQPQSTTQIEKAKHGKAEFVRKALDLLVKEGYVERFPGSRNAVLHRHLQTFRQVDPDLFDAGDLVP